jgi:cobalamin synthase
MLEAAIAVVGIVACWLVGVVAYKENMSFKGYVLMAFLATATLYFLIRFVHWAWITPFLGR